MAFGRCWKIETDSLETDSTEVKAQHIQFVWFPTTGEGLSADGLLRAIYGVDPDLTQTNRTPSPQTPYLSQATHFSSNVQHVTQVDPGRVSLTVAPRISNGPALPTIDFVPTMSQAIERIENAQRLFAQSAYRVGVIAVLAFPFDDLEAANAKFTALTNVPLKSPSSRDAVFQEVTRTESLHTTINQLKNVAVGEVEFVEFSVGKSVPFPTGAGSRTSYVVNVTLDFNTVPGQSVTFESDHLKEITLHLAKSLQAEARTYE